MKEFILAHPWMTFWLVVLAIIVIDSIGCEIARAWALRNRKDLMPRDWKKEED